MDRLAVSGDVTLQPAVGSPSGIFGADAVLAEFLQLLGKEISTYQLGADAPQDVAFGGLTAAHAIVVKPVGGPLVDATITFQSGKVAHVPVDGVLILISATDPAISMTLTRPAGVPIEVDTFLGQKA